MSISGICDYFPLNYNKIEINNYRYCVQIPVFPNYLENRQITSTRQLDKIYYRKSLPMGDKRSEFSGKKSYLETENLEKKHVRDCIFKIHFQYQITFTRDTKRENHRRIFSFLYFWTNIEWSGVNTPPERLSITDYRKTLN